MSAVIDVLKEVACEYTKGNIPSLRYRNFGGIITGEEIVIDLTVGLPAGATMVTNDWHVWNVDGLLTTITANRPSENILLFHLGIDPVPGDTNWRYKIQQTYSVS